ncbi:MAG: hypothetical protein SAK29_35115 [Scytonema sp. PMC 1069.18]|nr:hypothetical protein [Scytonema sp. PMC 1069.18]MEC4883389.1 hypothetical protein [Scytonema sp. PMC 1070.18]
MSGSSLPWMCPVFSSLTTTLFFRQKFIIVVLIIHILSRTVHPIGRYFTVISNQLSVIKFVLHFLYLVEDIGADNC